MKIKHFMDNWEAPHFREKKGSPWKTFIVSALILILIIVLIQSLSNQDVQQNIQELIDDVISEPAQQADDVVQVEPAFVPEFRKDCDVVAGTVPGSLTRTENSASISFKNNGRKNIEGSYFEFSDGESKIYTQNTDVLAPGDLKTYSVDLTEAGVKLSKRVASFIIIPIQDGKACENQQMIVFSDRAEVMVNAPVVAS